jgi:nicotinate-nucleotide adenylyltransferase
VATRAIFGGSFDPPHVGHVLAVNFVLLTEMVELVTVVPVFEHAFDKDMADYEARLALARAAFRHLPEVEVSEVEQRLPTPSYTVRTLEALAEQYPTDELRLMIGADLLADARRWVRFDEVCRLAPLLVLGRVGAEGQPDWPAVLPEVSSSQVRAWLAGPPTPGTRRLLEQAVPAAVLREIVARGLYRAS